MSINVFFCDDIRVEKDGRRSYMGVYEPTFKVQGSRILIPIFCVSAELRSSRFEDFVNAKLILRNGNEIVGEFPFVDNENFEKLKTLKSFIRIDLSVSPLVVDAPVVVSASLLSDGEETIVRELKFINESDTQDAPKKKVLKKKVVKET